MQIRRRDPTQYGRRRRNVLAMPHCIVATLYRRRRDTSTFHK